MDYSKHNTEKQRKKIRSGVEKSKKKLSFNIFRFSIIAVILVVVVGVAAVIGGFKGIIDSAPEISASDVMPSKLKSVMYYSDGTVATELVGSESNRTLISIEDMPDALANAFIAIEDERFYEHNGIDPKGIVRAMFVGLTTGDFSQGASTITQQLIKLTVFDGGAESDTVQRFKRKFQEWYLALQLEEDLTKDEILEAYLNTINLGRGSYGVESAAQRYFGKSASDLTISECAVIAAIAQSPTYNNPIDGEENNAERRAQVLSNMLSLGFITQNEYDEAMADDVYSRIEEVNETTDTTDTVYTWFEDAAIDQVLEDLQTELGYTSSEAYSALYSGGLQIYLTQDRHIQDIVDGYYTDDSNFTSTEYRLNWALSYLDEDGEQINIDENSLQSYYGNSTLLYASEEAGQAAVDSYKEELGIDEDDIIAESISFTVQAQSSFVLMDQSTGYVLALAGGRGEKTTNRSFNRATQALRQPGSVFKVLAVFLPGLDSCGLTLASTKVDEPYTTPSGTEIFNYNSSSYRGTTTVRQAITSSINVVTTKWLVEDVTTTVALEYLEDVGISTLDAEYDAYDTLGLGGIYYGVSNLELTAAYAAIANGGVYTEPILYTKILDADGNVLINNVPETHTAMKESTAWLLTSAMEDVVTKGTGTATRISNSGIAQAGKTGTTSNTKDLWFVGFTPYYTAGIWLGYDDSESMEGRISSSYEEHKKLWKNIMDDVLEGYDDADFEMPSTVEKATICSVSGLLASSSACTTVTEYFDVDTIPTEYCSSHVAIKICSECGLRATSQTPDEYIVTRYYSSYSSAPSEYCQHKSDSESDSSNNTATSGDTDNTNGNTENSDTGNSDDSGDSQNTGGDSGNDTGDDSGGNAANEE